MKRRTFTAGLVALPFLGASLTRAFAQDAAGPLPNTYSGQKIRALASTGAAFEAMATVSRDFTEATGIAVEYVNLSYNEQYQKLILDLTSGAASFDVFNFAYQWKFEIEPYCADLSNIPSEIPGAPDLALDDYPQRALEIYGRANNKLIGLPTLGDVTLFVWNKEAYKAAGLDPEAAPNAGTGGERPSGQGRILHAAPRLSQDLKSRSRGGAGDPPRLSLPFCNGKSAGGLPDDDLSNSSSTGRGRGSPPPSHPHRHGGLVHASGRGNHAAGARRAARLFVLLQPHRLVAGRAGQRSGLHRSAQLHRCFKEQ
ncbi:Glycerol-3-phosphate ABC transporter, periplasmic glycerol-3-phosphate-binding protein (plasmid) [Sinorhizobium fredii CCBAU 83666]|nr:Glycerol-3-phosphate ABC transporter, periplasmic glycerol-3-phosphate-binding protein [Sinorhizobium fredii CCBAU 83666]